MKEINFTHGGITGKMVMFAWPMIAGNFLQQLYNVTDTVIVGKYLGANALAAVGSAYALMTFITSILLGLSLGSGAVFSMRFGEQNWTKLKNDAVAAFVLIAVITVIMNIVVFAAIELILTLMVVPETVRPLMRTYLSGIFWGIGAVFIYNFFASLLRAVGDSLSPLIFLGVAAAVNIVLDLWFVVGLEWGVAGAAWATVIAQWMAAAGIVLFMFWKKPELRIKPGEVRFNLKSVKDVFAESGLTCMQQSVMNFGILMVQGLVNSFGATVMAAFAVAVKIESFAYMPLQDMGNAFATFAAQNYGAGKWERIRKGISSATRIMLCFSLPVAVAVVFFAEELLLLFIRPEEKEIMNAGVEYLRIVGPFLALIGGLFILYGLFRAVNRPGISLVLTIISLGTRVALAYILSSFDSIGVHGIWWAVPIGWLLADVAGIAMWRRYCRNCTGVI